MRKKVTKPKKRNPQDATLRNIRALKKRVEALEDSVNFYEKKVNVHLMELGKESLLELLTYSCETIRFQREKELSTRLDTVETMAAHCLTRVTALSGFLAGPKEK